MSASTLRRQVGRLLIAGLEGTELTALERAWLEIVRPSGVILFRRNIESPAQTHALLTAASARLAEHSFRCVDLEGGLVDRLRDAVAPLPSAAAIAATGKPALFRRHGSLIARGARGFGFNTIFAPVLDLALPASTAVMRTRTASATAEGVTAYAAGFFDGLAGEGVLGCGKHFPGLGGGTLDSHHAMPSIERTWDELWQQDLAPYRSLRRRLPLVMVAHASYPLAAPSGRGDTPASISSFWIGEVLVRRIGYTGLIVSDDMEMGGILTRASMEEAAVSAVLAGMHLLEICKDPSLVLRAFEALLSEAERSAAFRRIVERAARKVTAHSRRLSAAGLPAKPLTAIQVEKLRRQVRALAASAPEPTTA